MTRKTSKRSATSAAVHAPPSGLPRASAALLAWAAVGAAGVGLLAVALAFHRVGDYYTETDFYGGYAPGARLLQRGLFDASRYGVSGPVYDAALALLGFVVPDLFVAGEAIAIVSALAALAMWFTLLRERAGVTAAAWTTALLAANATFFRHGYSATTDALALALQAGALHLALAGRERQRPFAAGCCLALAAMTRYTAVALLPALLLAPAFSPRMPGRSRARQALLVLAGFAVVVVPFVAGSLRQRHVPGELLFHNVAYDTYASGQGRTLADYQSFAQPGLRSLGETIARDPLALARREIANLHGHAFADAHDLLGWPLAAMAVIGLALLFAKRRARVAGPLALCGLALYLALVPAPASARYSLVLAPFYLALAGMALGSPDLPFATLRRRLAPVAGAVLLVVALLASVREQRETIALLPVETLEVARVLRDVPLPERRVMALKPHLAWLAAAEFAPLPVVASLESLAVVCRNAGTRYLYISWIETNNRPALWFLLDRRAPVRGLRPVASTARPGAVLYRIEPGFGETPAWLADDALRAASARRFLALAPAPLRGRAHLTLAVWARSQDRFEEVREHAQAALAADPNQEYAWRLLGDTRLAGGDRGGAIACFERAVELAPRDADARVALGWMQLGAGNPAAAAAAWRPVVDTARDRATLQRMAALFAERGESAAAARARRALERLGR